MRLRYAVIVCKLVLIHVRVMFAVGGSNLVLHVLVDRPGAMPVSLMQPVAMIARKLAHSLLASNLVSFDLV